MPSVSQVVSTFTFLASSSPLVRMKLEEPSFYHVWLCVVFFGLVFFWVLFSFFLLTCYINKANLKVFGNLLGSVLFLLF